MKSGSRGADHWLSTSRCLSKRPSPRLRSTPRIRARGCTSTQPSDAAVTRPAYSNRSRATTVCSRSIAIPPPSPPLAGASNRSRAWWWLALRSARSIHWSRHMAKDVPVAGFCSTSACLRRSSTKARAASASSRTVRSTCAWTRRLAKAPPHWLAHAEAGEIRDVIGALGEERFAGRIARAIIEHRTNEPITTTTQLAQIVCRCGAHPRARQASGNADLSGDPHAHQRRAG